MIALSPTAFRSCEEYIGDVSNLVKRIKNMKTAEGFREVLLPGSWRRVFREKEVEELRRVAEKLIVEPPKPMAVEV